MGKGKGQVHSTPEESASDLFYAEAKSHAKSAGSIAMLAARQAARAIGLALYGWSVKSVPGVYLASAESLDARDDAKGMN
ncbi:MAG: hypothetical protein IPK60_22910 [Sandaracinaceae bacterium]|nr:hypothetical protein [Sandaracinaceae bacterium]